MPFLGQQPVEGYKTTAKQTITGDGSTSYTLDNAVTSGTDLEVFVNNVRQEPGTDYSASGNTITFTTAVESSDSCWLVYQGRASTTTSIESDNLADGSVTAAKLDTTYAPLASPSFTGAVGINRDNSGNEPYIALTIRNTGTSAGLALDCDGPSTAYGSGQKWEIQSNPDGQLITYCRDTNLHTSKHHSIGAITTPNQPRFSAGIQNAANYSQGSTVIFNANVYNPTGDYNSSNGRFTAPIDGFYQFNFAVRYGNTPSTGVYLRIRPQKNGGHMEYIVGDPIGGTYMANQTHTSTTMSFGVQLAAGDYIHLEMDNQGGQTVSIANSGWSGYLVG